MWFLISSFSLFFTISLFYNRKQTLSIFQYGVAVCVHLMLSFQEERAGAVGVVGLAEAGALRGAQALPLDTPLAAREGPALPQPRPRLQFQPLLAAGHCGRPGAPQWEGARGGGAHSRANNTCVREACGESLLEGHLALL